MVKSKILFVGFFLTSASLASIGCDETETNGSTNSGGAGGEASSSSSSSSGMGGAGGSGMMTLAEKYCTDIMANCTGSYAQYPSKESCMASAAAVPAGKETDTSGNTLGCRAYHASASKGDPATHCPHGGPAGADTCGNTCEGFCAIAAVTCKAEWPIVMECMTSCMGWTSANMPYNTSFTSGNTTECRLYHLSVASESAASAATHCPHTVAMSDTCK